MMWERRATTKDLSKALAILPDGQFQLLRESIDDSRADTMQTTSGFIDPFFKLASRMGHGQNNRGRGPIIALVEHGIKRHAASFVAYGNPPLAIQRHPDMFAITSNSLINRVIQRLPEQMDQARGGGRANIHARSM